MSDRSWLLSFIFNIDHIYMISQAVVLSGFCQSQHLIWSITIVQYHENVDHTYRIDRVVFLFGFRYKLHPVWSIIIVQ